MARLATDRWADGRFRLMAMFAQVAAASADVCFEVLQAEHRNRFLTSQFARGIEIEDWLKLYLRRSWVEGIGLQMLTAPEDVSARDRARSAANGVRQSLRRKMLPDTVDQAYLQRLQNVGQRQIERYYRQVHLPMLDDLLHESDEIPSTVGTWLGRPEVIFIVTVAMPCWLEFQVSPWQLFKKAAQGDFQATEQLLRLDPDADKAPLIARQMFRMRQAEPKRYQMLQRASSEGLTVNRSFAEVKYLIGGLLIEWSKEIHDAINGGLMSEILLKMSPVEMHQQLKRQIKIARRRISRSPIRCRLTASDISKLFDAVAQDRGDGPVDRDFCLEPDSRDRRLRRNAKVWPSLRNPDKRQAS